MISNSNPKLTYLIVEDIPDVAGRLQHEMGAYPQWQCAGVAAGVKQARALIEQHKPALLFCDWDLVGGSGFEVLEHAGSITGYQPFVVFNTGFQSDHPEIAEQLVNTYRPDVFINKPYWKKLKEQLPDIVQRAALKSSQRQTGHVVWLTLANGTRFKANLNDLVCVIQSADNPRNKLLYLAGEAHPAEINATWKEASDMLQQAGIDHFAVNKRYALVSRKFIHSYRPPFVHTNGCPLKIEVVSEQAKAFEQWLHMQ